MSISTNSLLPISLLSSFTCLIVLGLCMLTAVQLMRRYRQKANFITLIGGITLALVPQLLHIIQLYSTNAMPLLYYLTSTMTTIISFIIINFVIIKMYVSGVQFKLTPSLLLVIGAIAATTISLLVQPYELEGNGNLAFPILDLYMFVLLVTIVIVTRQLALPSIYFISLSVMFIHQIANMLHQYVFKQAELWLSISVQMLPIIYYVLLFYMLLEWIMERLLTTYQNAIYDELTGLYTRKHFQKKLTSMLQRKNIAVIFCDIDNFKQLNDTKGHQFADSALKHIASIIKEEVQPYGVTGRYGGEELLAAVDISRIKIKAITEKIRARVENETLVTISIGYCTTKESDDLSSLIKFADEAMYHAKKTGKNKVVSYSSIPAAYKHS